jgi:hypothetical protein
MTIGDRCRRASLGKAERPRATLDRDLDAGRHIATVIVVHESGRLYFEAIIFTTTAP